LDFQVLIFLPSQDDRTNQNMDSSDTKFSSRRRSYETVGDLSALRILSAARLVRKMSLRIATQNGSTGCTLPDRKMVMKKIPLTCGQFALVNDEFAKLNLGGVH